MTDDKTLGKEAHDRPTNVYTSREIAIAGRIYDLLRSSVRGVGAPFLQGDPRGSDETDIDGTFDLKQIARALLVDL